jgi:arylsulfatase A-like enzyme
MPPDVETIPEILEPHGYKNLAVVSNYVLRSVRGWAPGFVIYDDTMNQQELIRSTIPERIATYTTDRAIELIEQFRNDRLFMWVHYQDPHGPFTPPEKFAEMFLDTHQKPRILKVNDTKTGRGGIPHYQRLGDNRDFNFYVSQYDGEIRYMDEHFGRLIDTLRRLDLYDDSIIIFTSDHGEGMGEHDYYFNHGEYLYSDQIHVPLIIKYGKQLSGRRTDFVQHLDLIPTILSMLGIKPDERFRGRDLRKAKKESKEIFAEMRDSKVRDGVKFSLIVDPFKLIYTPIDKQYELFDLREDYYEKHDLINDANYKKQAEDLKARLHRIHEDDRLQLEIFNIPPKLTDEEIRKLRSLGYLD